MWKPPTLSAALLFLFLPFGAANAAVPQVVVSLQPLHSLAAMVMDGVGQPKLLVNGMASEHGYVLKPSDARALESAQLVVMVDRDYETFMDKPLDARTDAVKVLAMADLPGMRVLKPREGGAWEAHHHDPSHGHDQSHAHADHEELDGHLWLDVGNARLLLVALAESLAEIDPEHAEVYRANAHQAAVRLTALDGQLKAKLEGVADRPFVVFHDGYQYFESRYGLNGAGSITVDPDRPPSAKRLSALADKLRRAKAACVFREPQFPAPVVESLADAAGAKVGVLDPQGAALPPGPGLYPALLGNLADSLTNCLSAR